MTGLPTALAAGLLAGLGVSLTVVSLVPAVPALGDALDRLATTRPPAPAAGARDRVGTWAGRRLPRLPGLTPAESDLALLRLSPARFWGDKVVRGLAGLAIAPVASALWLALGRPVTVPVVLGLALSALLFLTPDLEVRSRAAAARLEFARCLGAYADLVALERLGGSGPGQALEAAAEIGDSWPFARLREELQRASLLGMPPWTRLRQVADEVDVRELADLADILRLSGEAGAAVSDTLTARATAVRVGLLQAEQARANARAERLTFPVVLLAVTFLATLLVAQGMRLLAAGPA
ncbi:MAG: type II secretion system F family protein [Kineosporiaceae bacterium]